jgi:hypothetical protein
MKPRSTKPIARSRLKKHARKPSEFARIYGSKERVEFVKSLPCQMCFIVGQTVNAHVGKEGKGMQRKANYDQIAALCPRCHSAYDNHEEPYADGWNRMLVLCAMDRTERLWQESIA